eukprot:TRINITY_DN6547_c1_g2_i1.p1 TRINITY_DN6547_c1_g2~~TRINITY_DN6547_c1_g2_i1.p1  ORF type:complete len:323 (+),score=30.18 TRINITY_DN6547_c1_g2_i1:61-1029(+)
MFARGQILGFGTGVDINVTFEDAGTRRRVLVPPWHHGGGSKDVSTLYVFSHKEEISGEIVITTDPGEVVDYTELRMEFVGQLNTITPENRQCKQFSYGALDLEKAPTGQNLNIEDVKVLEYKFPNPVAKPHESYNGITSQVRYFLRVTIKRPYTPDIVEEQEIWVQNPQATASTASGIKMEVGLKDALHIEFEYNRRNYHLQDVVLGKIFFLLVKIRIKYMELSLLKRETSGSYHEHDTMAKYEVMDGHPVAGETIPVRFFLSPFKLTPTYKQVEDKFSVKYYLNLVLMDENDRRYYKQQEITLWRKTPNTTKVSLPVAPPV